MILDIDFSSNIPIYMQIRNQIVIGISEKKLMSGDRLPTIRSLAEESGINMMTVNKAYQLLKTEGYIIADRRSGAMIAPAKDINVSQGTLDNLKLNISELRLSGMSKTDILALCEKFCNDSIK